MLRADHCRGLALLALALAVLAPRAASAGCDTQADRDAVAAIRALGEERCNCADATSIGSYKRCVAGVANEQVLAGNLPSYCRLVVIRCAARSICGRRSALSVTCCRINHRGIRRCRVVGHPGLCRTPAGGIGCVTSAQSCCDACATGCATTSTTTTTTSTTIP